MTRRQIFLLLIAIGFFKANAQPVIDGVINTNENYILISNYTSSNNSFGDANNLGALYYRYGVTAGKSYIYVGVTGRIDGSNNIVVFMDFSNYKGRSTGTLGGATTSNMGVFSTSTGAGDCSGNGGLNSATMSIGFDADYAFAFNEGSGTSSLFCDAMRFSELNSTPDGYFEQGSVGSVNQTGTSGTFSPLPFQTGCGADCPGSMTFAYRGDYNPPSNVNHGIEMRIPVLSLPGVAPGDYVKFFVVITNQFGFMSDESLPSIMNPGNAGCDANLSVYNNLFTGLWLLPVNFLQFDAKLEKNTIDLTWKVAGNKEQKQYLVERSRDGNRFELITAITATGEDEQEYRATDFNPQEGWNFYRITAEDRQSKKKSSSIIRVYYGQKAKPAIVPNPVQGSTISFLTGGLPKGLYQIQVTGLDGRRILNRLWQHDGLQNAHSFETPAQLSPGMYWLVLQSEGQSPVRLKIIKQ